jgi:hypothetical protein
MNSIQRMRLISVGIWALLVLAAVVSASHIVDTAGTLGLSGWYRYAAVALIDFVAIVGKLSMHEDFKAPFRKSGFRLLMTGGALSLAANIYAGDNLGEKGFGVLTVSVFMLLEHHATKAGKAGVERKAATAGKPWSAERRAAHEARKAAALVHPVVAIASAPPAPSTPQSPAGAYATRAPRRTSARRELISPLTGNPLIVK